MADNDQLLEKIGKLLQPMKEQLDTVEMKVELVRSENKKEHMHIVDMLLESNEVNGKEVKQLRERVEKIEEALHISKN